MFSDTAATSSDSASLGTFDLGQSRSLDQGIYSQGVSEQYAFPLLYRKDIVIPSSTERASYAVMQHSPAACCFGTEPFEVPHTSYAQSFKATGDNLVSVAIRTVYPASGEVEVAILDGEPPSAQQIGPSKRLAISGTNIQCAYWSAGEVQTVPGRIYTARFTLVGGGAFTARRQMVRNQMSEEIPDGHTWLDGVPTDQHLEIVVNQDGGGLINTMCCPQSGLLCYGNKIGQTFVAKGTSVLAVTWQTEEMTQFVWAVSIHNGPGIGSGGPQIGPAKLVLSTGRSGASARSVVTFAPGEVPTTPGQTYFVSLRHNSTPSNITMYSASGDIYAGGKAYTNGVIKNYDWALGIYEESASGALDQAQVSISNFRIDTIGASSAVARWSTSLPADSTVEYGEITPYACTVADPALTREHAIVMSGLKANTLHHVRVRSKVSGARDGATRDRTFVTAADTPNLLSNAGFESGVSSAWTRFGKCSVTAVGPNWLSLTSPHNGVLALGGSASAGAEQGGAYQRVPAAVGQQYSLSAWVLTHTDGANYPDKAHQTAVRVGIDPAGGIDPSNSSIVWSSYTYSQATYSQVQVSAAATSNFITVYLYGGYMGNESSIGSCVFVCDDVVLTAFASLQPAAIPLMNALVDYADGSQVIISDAICTAIASQVGAFYVESADRANGLRVETTDAMNVGDKLMLSGVIQTKPSGERYLAGATVNSRSASTAPKALLARLVAVGGNNLGRYCVGVHGTSGPYNAGMLLRCVGTVRAFGSGCVYVNDGSLPGTGIKVATTRLTKMLTMGQTVAVTGIVQLEGDKYSARVLLTPRNDSDVSLL